MRTRTPSLLFANHARKNVRIQSGPIFLKNRIALLTAASEPLTAVNLNPFSGSSIRGVKPLRVLLRSLAQTKFAQRSLRRLLILPAGCLITYDHFKTPPALDLKPCYNTFYWPLD